MKIISAPLRAGILAASGKHKSKHIKTPTLTPFRLKTLNPVLPGEKNSFSL